MRTREDDAARLALFPQWMMVLSGAVVLTAALALGHPIRAPYAALAGGLVLAATVALIVVRRRIVRVRTEWVALVPIVDIVAVGIQHGAFGNPFPLAGLLYAIPLAWLAFAFPLPLAGVGIAMVGISPLAVSVSGGRPPLSLRDPVAIVLYCATAAIVVAAVSPIGRAVRRERALSAERARTLEAVLAASENAIIVYAADGRLRLSNRAGDRIIARAGFPRTAPSGRDRIRVYAADRRTPLTFTIESLLALAGSESPARTVWIGDPGDQIAVRYVVAPIDPAGPSAGTVVNVSEVTEMIESIEIRDAFLDTISHELRTPLTVLFGHVDLALETTDQARLKSRLALIDEGLSQMRDRIERLLVTHREAVAAIRDTTDPTYVIDEVAASSGPAAAAAGVAIHRRVREVPTARVSARGLGIIVAELVKNAILFTPAGGSVDIRAYRGDDGGAVIEVADTGIGMSPDERRRAFDRFYRAPLARERGVPGAGLGLSLVASIAARNDIVVELSGNSAGGTTVTLTLPPG